MRAFQFDIVYAYEDIVNAMRVPLLYFKMGLFIFAVCLGFLFIGYQWGGRAGLFVALIAAIAWMSLIWVSDEAHWLNLFSAKRLDGQDSWGILTRIEIGARRLHVDPPNVYLVNSRSSFLLSLSLGLSKDALLISRQVLNHFSDQEIEALLLSELASLWLRRKFRFRWFHLIALSFVRSSELGESLIPWGRRTGIFRRITLPISQLLLKICMWHRFELERDRLTLSIISDRRPLASAMWKLKSLAQVYPLDPPPGSAHLFLVSPNRTEDDGHFLSLHAPLSARMRRILGAELI